MPYIQGVSDWKQLALYLLPEDYGSLINDIDRDNKNVAECRWALITEYLKVGELSWDKVVYALRKSGYPNIAEKIRKDNFNTGELPTKPPINHKKCKHVCVC